jgi:hypothetical protein
MHATEEKRRKNACRIALTRAGFELCVPPGEQREREPMSRRIGLVRSTARRQPVNPKPRRLEVGMIWLKQDSNRRPFG